jgi:hypothetical protein
MEYPVPIDAAGRTVLVILCLALLRFEAGSWLAGLPRLRIRPSAWLEHCARFGFCRTARRLGFALVRGLGVLALAIVCSLWAVYALARLADDFAASPTPSAVGSALAAILCRVAR